MNNENKNLLRRSSEKEMNTYELRHIMARLDQLRFCFEREADTKQRIIDRLLNDIERLKHALDEREAQVFRLQNEMHQCQQKNEGNHQLINKLLNDISRYQNDIEWFKRTYEKRSFLGVIKDKLIH